jgi:hypothetical protein
MVAEGVGQHIRSPFFWGSEGEEEGQQEVFGGGGRAQDASCSGRGGQGRRCKTGLGEEQGRLEAAGWAKTRRAAQSRVASRRGRAAQRRVTRQWLSRQIGRCLGWHPGSALSEGSAQAFVEPGAEAEVQAHGRPGAQQGEEETGAPVSRGRRQHWAGGRAGGR